MKYPWANFLILLLAAIELATGLLGLVNGSPAWAGALHVHRVCGFGIVALLLWKGRNVLASLARLPRRGGVPIAYLGSLALLVLLLSSLGLGLAWSHGGPFSFAGFSGVSWHIYLSLAMAPLLLWHTLRQRWTLRPRFWAERRSVLRLAGLAVAGLALWRVGEGANSLLALPGRDRRFTGSYERGSFSGNAFPTTSWLNDNPRPLDPEGWGLRVAGHVERDLEMDGRQVESHRDSLTATLDCTGGWHSTQEWEGAAAGDGPGAGGGQAGGRERDGAVGDWVHPPVLGGGGPGLPAGDQGRRRAPLPRPRVPHAAGGAGKARLRLGEVGHRRRGERHRQVVAAAPAPHVAPLPQDTGAPLTLSLSKGLTGSGVSEV